MSLIIGVDPGLKGALALIDSYGRLLEVEDMPVMGKGVSVYSLCDILNDWSTSSSPGSDVTCVIENVHSMPGQGVATSFSFGRSKGVVEAAAAAFNMRLVYVSPAKWKRDMKVTKNKGSSRDLASDRWPSKRPLFKRVMDDGRAEAALIALWQWEAENA